MEKKKKKKKKKEKSALLPKGHKFHINWKSFSKLALVGS
jgi:hypothetical protein